MAESLGTVHEDCITDDAIVELMSLFRESSLLCVIIAHYYYYSTYITKYREPHINWRNVGGHDLAVGMESAFDLRDL